MLNGKFESGDRVIITNSFDDGISFYVKDEKGIVTEGETDSAWCLVDFLDGTESRVKSKHMKLNTQ